MRELRIKDYYNLLIVIFKDCILKYNYVKISSLLIAILVFTSTYYSTKQASAFATLLNNLKGGKFKTNLKTFGIYSLIAGALKQIPLSLFTFIIQHISRNKFVESLRNYMTLPYYKFHKKTPGEIRFTVFLKSLSYPMCAQIIVFDFTAFIGIVIFTFIKVSMTISFSIAMILLVFPIVYIGYTIEYLRRRLMYLTKNLVEMEKTSAKIYDKLSNFDVIKTFNLEQSELDSLSDSIKGQVEAQMATDIFSAKGRYLGRFILVFPYILILMSSIILPQMMSSNDLFLATTMYISISFTVKKLGSQLNRLSTYLNQVGYDDGTQDLFNTTPDTILKTQPLTFESKIEFCNVNLYHRNNLIIKDLNFSIAKNEKIAVVGKNGTGKSTLIKAILGFTTYTGDILIDGINIKELSNKSLFSAISYISQEDYTSDDTILNNLRLGNREASYDFIIEKAKFMECHDMILGFENGYNTQAGSRGSKLSGGQRQILSLTRAIIKDSPIFILDEATSAIDKKYEARVMEILFENMKNKTIAMIIHENEYLKYFDRIFFLNNKILEDTGSLNELVERNNNFRAFINK